MKFWNWARKKEPTTEAVHTPTREHVTPEMLNRPGMTQATFELLYARLIEERLGGSNLHYIGDGGIVYEDAAGKSSTAYPYNAWRQCEQADEPRNVVVDRYLAALQSINDEAPPERTQIIPIVRDQEYLSFASKVKVQAEHLAADLWIIYALDLPTATKALTFEQMQQASVTRAELHELALRNLASLLPEIECIGDGPWFMLTAGPDYGASLLLLDEIWDEMATKVEGDVVAVAPSRDVVLFTGSDSPEGLQAIRKHAAEVVRTGHHVVSETLLRRLEGKWANFN